MVKENLTDRFVDLICSIKFEDISDSALSKLRTCLVDTIGVIFAGAKSLKDKEDSLLQLLNDNNGDICPIGHNIKTSLSNSILVNGLSSHFLELDDGSRYGVLHPSAPLFSALIPVAIAFNASWENFVLGAICGYETSIRIAHSIQPTHYSLGYHPTANCCTLGVAVAIAVMLGGDRKQVKDSLSAAAISACGSLKVIEDDSQLKPYNCGKAALMGYYSALMARAGFNGSSDSLGGETGFLSMMSSSFNEDDLLGKKDSLAIEKVYLKPYASCRHTHPEIEAAFSIRENPLFNVEQIKNVYVKTYKGVIGKHDFKEVNGEAAARMSIPYSIAVALITGKAGIGEFTDKFVNDKEVRHLTNLVTIEGDEELSLLVPDKRVAIVRVVMSDGNILEKRVDYPKGEPENPLNEKELYEKFSFLMDYAGVSKKNYDTLFKTIMHSDIIVLNHLFYG